MVGPGAAAVFDKMRAGLSPEQIRENINRSCSIQMPE